MDLTFREECIGAHHRQLDLVLYAYLGKKPVGSIEHVRFEEKIYISMIFVDPYYRRRGIATALWAELERLNPGRPIVIGNKTDDGEKFFRALKQKDGSMVRKNRDTGKRGQSMTSKVEESKAVFVDAQAMHRQHPDTFEAPSKDELRKIKPGDLVKVSAGDERFWVKVIDHRLFIILGKVDNDLVNTSKHGIRLGDLIVFHQDCVYSIMHD